MYKEALEVARVLTRLVTGWLVDKTELELALDTTWKLTEHNVESKNALEIVLITLEKLVKGEFTGLDELVASKKQIKGFISEYLMTN